MIAVDLFAGTGGATVAFAAAGWTVLEVDLGPPDVDASRSCTRHRILADVRHLPFGLQLRGRVDFLWASPPCTEFSDANPRVDHATKRPSLELVAATLEAVADIRPRFWILENVRGAIPFLGVPAQKIGPFCLWGYFPMIDATWTSATYRKWSAGRSPRARAAVPRALSRAVLEAVDRGRRLPSILDMRPFRRHRHVRVKRAAVIASPTLFPADPE